ncbi:MAG: hypothetical protein JJT94_03590 [Bernardetiaceae bacterium]|nr:hypothetical protein [Bernardetiaceae bacterium]
MKIEIANPIYDVVFKYLLADLSAAKLFIETIIGYTVLDIELKPQEKAEDYISDEDLAKLAKLPLSLQRVLHLSLFRLDFLARIRTESGEKTVMIEIQKESLPNDIMRFRKYLSGLYADKNAFYPLGTNLKHPKKVGIPIIAIYILGNGLPVIKDVAVLKIDNILYDCGTQKVIEGASDYFVESLTHKSFIISIPALSGRRRTEVEQLLSIFDQENKKQDNRYLLELDAKTIPKKFDLLLRCLKKASELPQIRKQMEELDTIYDELHELLQFKEYYQQEVLLREEEQRMLQEEKRMREEEQRMLQEEKRKREEEQRMREKEQRMREFFELQAVKLLYAQSKSVSEIALQLQMLPERVEELIKNFLDERNPE